MPKVPPYLTGIRSYKVRALVNLLAGVLGVTRTTDFKGPQGLVFTALLVDHGRPGDVEWALQEAAWTVVATDPGGEAWEVRTEAPCLSFGTIAGRLQRVQDEDGSWRLLVNLHN